MWVCMIMFVSRHPLLERGGRLMIIVSLFIEKIAQDTSVDSKKQDWSNPLLPNFK